MTWKNVMCQLTFALGCLMILAFACIAQATPAINGVYDGTYQCGGNSMTLRLAIVATADGSARGRITFSQMRADGTISGSFNLKGSYDAQTNKFKLDPQSWNPPIPYGFPLLGVDGKFDPTTNQISGNLTAGCSAFTAKRNEAESAALPNGTPETPAIPTH